MINFRYHIVSLIGIFLALGVGLLFGTALIPEAQVKALEDSQRNLGQQNARLRAQVEDLQDLGESLSQYVEASEGLLVAGALERVPLVVISFDTSDQAVVSGVLDVLSQARATVTGGWRISDRIDASTDARRTQVALALGIPTGDREEVLGRAVAELAGFLAGGGGDIMARLEASGLTARLAPDAEDLEARVPEGASIVVIAPEPDEGGLEGELVAPLVHSLADEGVRVSVAGVGVEGGLVALLRDQDGRFVTVDSAETPLGRVALVLGIRGALLDRFGHYGVGAGADQVVADIEASDLSGTRTPASPSPPSG